MPATTVVPLTPRGIGCQEESCWACRGELGLWGTGKQEKNTVLLFCHFPQQCTTERICSSTKGHAVVLGVMVWVSKLGQLLIRRVHQVLRALNSRWSTSYLQVKMGILSEDFVQKLLFLCSRSNSHNVFMWWPAVLSLPLFFFFPMILEQMLVVLETIRFYLNNNCPEISSYPLISSKILLVYLHHSSLIISLKFHVTSAWSNLGRLNYCPFSAINNHLIIHLQKLSFTFQISSNSHEKLFSDRFFFFFCKGLTKICVTPFCFSLHIRFFT